MQNNFEKEVQQKMEELQLVPSPPLWEKIALEIQPEKKRRRIFFWIFVALLIVGMGAWCYVSTPNRPLKSMPQAVIQRPLHKEVSDTFSPLNTSIKNGDKDTSSIIKNQKITVLTTAGQSTGNTLVLNKKIHNSDLNLRYPSYSAPSTLTLTPPSKTAQSLTQKDGFNSPVDSSIKVNTKNEEIVAKSTDVIYQKSPLITDSAKKEEIKKLDSFSPAKTDSATKIKLAKRNKTWRRIIRFNIGVSNYSTTYAGLSTAPAQYNSGVSVSNPPATNYTPSATKAGLSFSIGYGFKKAISNRLQLGLALQYSYYSTSNGVGSLQTSSRTFLANADTIRTNQYYTAGTQQHYRNKFGFLELPVYLQYDLSKSLSVSAGVAYGRLLKSNALTYDYSSGSYYFNRANNKRSQMNMSAALQYQFHLMGKLKIQAGPAFRYNLLRLQNDAGYPAKHLFAAGLQTEIFF